MQPFDKKIPKFLSLSAHGRNIHKLMLLVTVVSLYISCLSLVTVMFYINHFNCRVLHQLTTTRTSVSLGLVVNNKASLTFIRCIH